jgi:hypothetical protein
VEDYPVNFDEQTISDLLKRMRAVRSNKSLPDARDLADFQQLAQLVHVIDGLSFRQHFGEVMLYLLTQVDSVPGEGDRQEPTTGSKPAADSVPHPNSKPPTNSTPNSTSNPVQRSVVNPVFEEPSTSSKPMENSAPSDKSNPPLSSAPSAASNPELQSNLFCVRTTQFWVCDDEKCGNDDLIMEMQLPSDKRKTEQIRYQCTKCALVGTAELTREEIEKAMKDEKRVAFNIGENIFDFLNAPRPAGKKRKSNKTQPDNQPGEPKGTPLLDAAEQGEQHMQAIAQEVKQSRGISATQNVQAPSHDATETPKGQAKPKSKKEGQAEATTFPSLGNHPSQQAGAVGTGAAGASAPVQQQETPAAVKKAVEKVIAAQVSPSEVVSDEMMKTLTSTVQGWALERLIKEWESMTGKVYKQGVTVPDAMVTEVVFQLAGVPMNA